MDNWGIIFTLYDVFACFNLKIVDEIGLWDNNLPWYFADIDYYRRLKLAGFKVIEAGQGVTHAASQTINSDPRLKFLNGITFPLHAAYYKAKWGGEPDHETFTEPFDGKLPE
jgi:GT2 family glycosyltransferase